MNDISPILKSKHKKFQDFFASNEKRPFKHVRDGSYCPIKAEIRAVDNQERGQVVSASDSQSGGPGFESRSGHLLDLCSVVPSSNSRPCL